MYLYQVLECAFAEIEDVGVKLPDDARHIEYMKPWPSSTAGLRLRHSADNVLAGGVFKVG